MSDSTPGSPLQRLSVLLAVSVAVAFGTSTVWLLVLGNRLEDRVGRLEAWKQARERQDASTAKPPDAPARPAVAKDHSHERQDGPAVQKGPAPASSYEIKVVAKQWLWKFEHPSGLREVGEVHLPAGKPVTFIVVSEDVIHRLDIPELGLKAEARPGEYTRVWSIPQKTGEFPFSCGQYCGVGHEKHRGQVTVVDAEEFDDWLNGFWSRPPGKMESVDGSRESAGRQIFLKIQCVQCHSGEPAAKGPNLEGILGRRVKLKDGLTVVADEAYLRESIRNPRGKVADGWEPIMPKFDTGKLSDDELNDLVEFLKSLKPREPPNRVDGAKGAQPRLEGVQQPRLESLRTGPKEPPKSTK